MGAGGCTGGGRGGARADRLMDMHFTLTHSTHTLYSHIHKDFNDALNHEKANALSRQTGGLPLKLQVTSLMCEDRMGYQLVTAKLSEADKPTDQAKFDNQPVG